jgi:hypothetical protein
MPCSPHSPWPGALLLAAVLVFPGLPRAAAADPEVRDFTTYIDGKRAGTYRMTIATQDDGTVSMTGAADINIRVLLVHYTYTYRGTEVWQGNRLLQLQSSSNDNGKAYQVVAVADANGLRLRVNGQEGRAPADTWLTTYWRLPEANARNRVQNLVDADTGRVLTATLQHIGASQISVAGQVQNCAHYRLAGGVQVDLWYDGSDRLVRQEWVEDNHKAVLELARVQR